MTTRIPVASGSVTLMSYVDGPDDGAPVVFSNSLGTDHSLWDPILPLLPEGLRLIRYDKRGHGASDVPPAPYAMGQLVSDAEAVCDAHGVKDAVFVGLSVGGMIAQGLAVKRLDLIRAAVLSNTGARIGTADLWQERIDTVRREGLDPLVPGILERWFAPEFRASAAVERWRDLLRATPAEGYAGTCAAIAGTDFYTTTAGLRLPVLGIAGSEDRATPPDLVRETVDLVPGARFHLIRRAGHLPCVERPDVYAEVLTDFLRDVGHV